MAPEYLKRIEVATCFVHEGKVYNLIYFVKNSVFRYEFFIDGWTVNEGGLWGFWYRKHIITTKL